MIFSGRAPDNRIVEMMEIKDHPWYIAVQFHPEFKSRPNRPHPLFKGFVGAALKYKESKQKRATVKTVALFLVKIAVDFL